MQEERILVCASISPDEWTRILLKAREYDVEAGTGPDYIYDARLRPTKDVLAQTIYIWGRDGWAQNFWHAHIYLERRVDGNLGIYMKRGPAKKTMSLIIARNLFEGFIASCLAGEL